MKITNEVREIERYVKTLSGIKDEQIAIISKAQSEIAKNSHPALVSSNEHALAVFIIAKNRIIKTA